MITTYLLRSASSSALHNALLSASDGKARPYAWVDGVTLRFDDARVRRPYAEMVAGDPDPETGVPTSVPTGAWLCNVALVDETDEALAAVAISVSEDEG